MIVRHTPLLRALGAALLLAAPAAAQAPAPLDVRGEVFVGSEVENYLRVLQVAGRGGRYPWAIRGFSPREVTRLAPTDSAHAWAGRYSFVRDSGDSGARWVRPQVQAIGNTTLPYGANDGPIWAGRGLTLAADAGVALERGAFSLTLNPMVFIAQNAGFELEDTGAADGPLRYADPEVPLGIDLPQRFGDGPYGRVDPGQSTLRLDAGILAAGVSTANQHWGPAADLPLILGHNAGGFVHAFAGSARPLNLGIGRLHGRLVWGRLDQSAYTANEEPRRFMSGAVAVFTPRGIPTLEVGGTRFFHTAWPADGLEAGNFLKPLSGLLKNSLGGGEVDGGDVDNQLASIFFRWYHPRSGVEAYGEYAREDHSADSRDLLLEPDHNSGYTLGARRVWSRADGSLVSLRGELMDARVTHLVLVRPQVPFYLHFAARQGHTQRGQLLGASSGYAGAGSTVALDRYSRRGRTSLTYTRTVRDRGMPSATAGSAPPEPEVTQGLGVEALRFMGRFDVTAGVTAAYQLNRAVGGDAFNLNTVLRVRLGL